MGNHKLRRKKIVSDLLLDMCLEQLKFLGKIVAECDHYKLV